MSLEELILKTTAGASSAAFHFTPYLTPEKKQAVKLQFTDHEGKIHDVDLNGDKVESLPEMMRDFKVVLSRLEVEYSWSNWQWEVYGVVFSLYRDGELIIHKTNDALDCEFEISGVKKIKVTCRNFKRLKLSSESVSFCKTCSVAYLELSANELWNINELVVQTLKINVKEVRNQGRITIANNSKLSIEHFDNERGSLYVAGELKLHTKYLDNTLGSIYADAELLLTIATFKNNFGIVGGYSGTIVLLNCYESNYKREFLNGLYGKIGIRGHTNINFWDIGTETGVYCEAELGSIYGDIVTITDFPEINSQGLIVANKEIHLRNKKQITLPKAQVQTPELWLFTDNFELAPQTECARTILKMSKVKDVNLAHEYLTRGTFEIHEPDVTPENINEVLQKRFGSVSSYDVKTLPKDEYTITIHKRLVATAGQSFFNPRAKLIAGLSEFVNLSSENGTFTAYLTELDLMNASVVAKNGKFHLPRGVTIARLIIDTTRYVYATYYSHQHKSTSSNLGAHIRPYDNYLCLGNKYNPYDGKHRLKMPMVTSNGSYMKFSGDCELTGAFNHFGALTARTLKHKSVGPSLIQAGRLSVLEDAELDGSYTLCRYTTNFGFGYQCDRGGPFYPNNYPVCNSDASLLEVQGKISGTATVTNKACIFENEDRAPEITVINEVLATPLYQLFVTGEVEDLPTETNLAITVRQNGIYATQYEPDAQQFLRKVRNMASAQNVFLPQSKRQPNEIVSLDKPLVGVNNSASDLIFLVHGDAQLGSSAIQPLVSRIVSPIRALASRRFNPHNTHVLCGIKELMQKPDCPDVLFAMREIDFYDEAASVGFYTEIMDSVVVVRNGKLGKPNDKVVFALSPLYLTESVKDECREVLLRGDLEDGHRVDLNYLKLLHQRALAFVNKHKAIADESLSELMLHGNNIDSEIEAQAMLIYQAMQNDEGVEVLFPFLYIPHELIDELQNIYGGLIRAGKVLILPDYLTPGEMLEKTKDRPALNFALKKFFADNPQTTVILHTRALKTKAQMAIEGSSVSGDGEITVVTGELTPASSITINCRIITKEIMALVENKLVVHDQITADEALLATILDDTVIESTVWRQYLANDESFDEIVRKASVKAKKILQMYPGKQGVFIGAETSSGIDTYIQSIGKILELDLPVVRQRVLKFKNGHEKVYQKDATSTPMVTKHVAGNSLLKHAKTGILGHGTQNKAKEVVEYTESGTIEHTSAHEVTTYEEQITTKSGPALFNETHSTNNMSQSVKAIGTVYDTPKLSMFSPEGIVLQSVFSTAELNVLYAPDGEVAILLGRNTFQSLSIESRSTPTLNKTVTEAVNALNLDESKFDGIIKITAKSITLEQVRDNVLGYLDQLEIESGDVKFITLEEYVTHRRESISGPGGAVVALAALAVGIATHGTMSNFATTLLGTEASTVALASVTAGLSSLTVQATALIVQNKGDILKATKQLASSKTIAAAAAAMLSAGLLEKMSETLNLPKSTDLATTQEQLQKALARATISSSLNLAIHGKSFEESMLDGLADATISIVADASTKGLNTKATIMQRHAFISGILSGAKGMVAGHGAVFGVVEGAVASVLPELVKKHAALEPSYNNFLGKSEFASKGSALFSDGAKSPTYFDYNDELLDAILASEVGETDGSLGSKSDASSDHQTKTSKSETKPASIDTETELASSISNTPLLDKIADNLKELAITIVTGSSAAEASPFAPTIVSVPGAAGVIALYPGSVSNNKNVPQFTFNKLWQEVSWLVKKGVLTLVSLASPTALFLGQGEILSPANAGKPNIPTTLANPMHDGEISGNMTPPIAKPLWGNALVGQSLDEVKIDQGPLINPVFVGDTMFKGDIPTSVRGPSGKPKIHRKYHRSKKEAREAAQLGGSGKPEHHASQLNGDQPHFHPTDKDGIKIDGGTHHYYPGKNINKNNEL